MLVSSVSIASASLIEPIAIELYSINVEMRFY
jgi:hypothetical protein